MADGPIVNQSSTSALPGTAPPCDWLYVATVERRSNINFRYLRVVNLPAEYRVCTTPVACRTRRGRNKWMTRGDQDKVAK